MKSALKDFLRKYFWLRYSSLAAHRLVICAKESFVGRPDLVRELGPETYAQTVLGYYKHLTRRERFHGRAVEVGPGHTDNLAHMLLESGCEHVDLVDRFFTTQNGDARIARHVAPAATFFRTHGNYDFIFSAAVLEHLYDPLTALRLMGAALKPGGTMVHLIDMRDHELFSPALHDLSFLRLPRWLYWPLAIQGGPNRIRLGAYRRCLDESSSLAIKLYATTFAGNTETFFDRPIALANLSSSTIKAATEHVAEIREQLAPPFKDLPDEDLTITSMAIVASR